MGLLIDSVWQQSGAGLSSRFGCFLLARESADPAIPSADRNLRDPLPSRCVPRNATIGRRAAGAAVDILPIPVLRRDAEVSAAAVQAIPVDVIAFESITRDKPEQFPVQPKMVLTAGDDLTSCCVAFAIQVPAPPSCQLGIGGVHDSVGADRSVFGSQRDMYSTLKAHRLPPVGGVTSPAVSAARGHFASNYTTGLRVGVA